MKWIIYCIQNLKSCGFNISAILEYKLANILHTKLLQWYTWIFITHKEIDLFKSRLITHLHSHSKISSVPLLLFQIFIETLKAVIDWEIYVCESCSSIVCLYQTCLVFIILRNDWMLRTIIEYYACLTQNSIHRAIKRSELIVLIMISQTNVGCKAWTIKTST